MVTMKLSIFGTPVLPVSSVSCNNRCVYVRARNPLCLSVPKSGNSSATNSIISLTLSLPVSSRKCSTPLRYPCIVPFASVGDSETGQAVQDPEIEDSTDVPFSAEESAAAEAEVIDGAAPSEGEIGVEGTESAIISALNSYKDALTNDDKVKMAEIESFFATIDNDKANIENKLASLAAELSAEKDRVLRISADFDNFRKRTERERFSQVTNAKGEVVETLLAVLDNFERAKSQIKIETEGEEKISNSYQSIYKQFVEILASLGVVPVETVGKPFDPTVHEAIMREDSSEFCEGIIVEEFRKGFKISDRLLRPSMVKVSAGPGPSVSETDAKGEAETESTDEESSGSESE